MKVGTDGVLLGAWCSTISDTSPQYILDIGTGTGLVALMLAQRNPGANVHAIEIDESACGQAAENFAACTWRERLHAICGCVRSYQPRHYYSLIASNPPWFTDSLKSPSASRNMARHDDTLNREELLTAVRGLLHAEGTFCTIMPTESGQEFIDLAIGSGLYCQRKCEVRPNPGRPPARLLLEFSRTSPSGVPKPETLTIETATRHDYTPEFRRLASEFYLRF